MFGPFGINLGIIEIKYYALIILSGAIAAAYLVSWLAKKRGNPSEIIWDGLVWAMIFGIIGARLWHVLTPSPSTGIDATYYFSHPLDLINIRNGGLGIYGGIIGGAVGLWFFCRKNKLPFIAFIDVVVPGLALGQAIGRWGNYVNGELCGSPTSLAWGISRCFNTGYPEGTHFHPVFLYESIWNIALMGFLLYLALGTQKRLRTGDLVLVYFMGYAFARFLLEYIRMDSNLIAGINTNQAFSAALFLGAGIVLVMHHTIKGKA